MMSKKSDIVTTVFADIEDSTGISNYFEKKDYEDFLHEFHKTVRSVLKAKEWAFIKNEVHHRFMGDEFVACFPDYIFPDEVYESALESALYFAATLKYEWYFSAYNKRRLLKSDKEVIELNIGINTGSLSLMQYPLLSGKKPIKRMSYEGFPITLAKRIQGVAEESQGSRIIVGDSFYRAYVRLTQRSYEFYYLGKKSFKGMAQRVSCYEWLGRDLFGLKFKESETRKREEIKITLRTLHEKNPHNPWYADLVANHLFAMGEEEYFKGKKDNAFYRECAEFCLRSINNIRNYNLRELNELLFICLEVASRWKELCIWSEQAFTSDPTFSGALALYAKALYMLGLSEAPSYQKPADAPSFRKAEEAANKVLTLFQESKDYESLYTANFILARYYTKVAFDKNEAMKHSEAAIKFAQVGDIVWAYVDYDEAMADFEIIQHDPKFKKELHKLEKVWETSKAK